MKKNMMLLAVAVLLASSVFGAGKELKVAVGLALPPYIIQDTGVGIEVDILKQALADAGYTVKLIFVPFARIKVALSDGTADAALTITEASGITSAIYSDSHVTYKNVVITLKSRALKISGIADLSKLGIFAFQDALLYLGSDFAAMAKGNAKYAEIADQQSQVKMLFAGRTDAIIMDINIYKYFKKMIKDIDVSQAVTIHEIFAPTNYNIGFKDKAVCDLFNAGLKKLKSSGKYDLIISSYIK